MGTTDGVAIPGVVAMSAREVKELRNRIAELEAALRQIAAPTCGTEIMDSDAELASVYRSHWLRFQLIARAALQQGER